mmetsp:Transcript_6654/g.16226  ORF Transcript_6654/g.16226 Transcript_6654/m.16226 type:complete len:237 (+) Transcript_6654:159-869(+)
MQRRLEHPLHDVPGGLQECAAGAADELARKEEDPDDGANHADQGEKRHADAGRGPPEAGRPLAALSSLAALARLLNHLELFCGWKFAASGEGLRDVLRLVFLDQGGKINGHGTHVHNGVFPLRLPVYLVQEPLQLLVVLVIVRVRAGLGLGTVVLLRKVKSQRKKFARALAAPPCLAAVFLLQEAQSLVRVGDRLCNRGFVLCVFDPLGIGKRAAGLRRRLGQLFVQFPVGSCAER